MASNEEDISEQLDALSKLTKKNCDKRIELLLKIFQNILKYPSNEKYQLLNLNKVNHKLDQCKECMDLLFCAGFDNKSDTHLQFNIKKLNKLKSINKQLLQYMRIKDSPEKPLIDNYQISKNDNNINMVLPQIIELMRLGVPADEAELALCMSSDSKQKINDVDMDEAVQCLMKNGFKMDESMNAIVKAQYDIKQALEILINNSQNADEKVEEKNGNNENETCAILISMGFEKDVSMEALQVANFDINAAIQYLLNDTVNFQKICGGCSGSMKHCKYLILLKETLTKYSSIKYDPHSSTSLLNSFHHLLFEHDTHEEFDEIFEILWESYQCDVSKCDKMRRNRQDKRQYATFVDDIFDKIHCYFMHSYDIGYRLTRAERQQIETLVTDTSYQEDGLNPSLTSKKVLATKTFQSTRKNALQKFNNYGMYAYGERYVYWDYFKTHNHGLELLHSLIHPRFNSLKEELISNPIFHLTVEQWKSEYNKAEIHQNSHYGKQFIANPETLMHIINPNNDPHLIMANGKIFGIQKGSKIRLDHLIAVIVYCGYDQLSYEFRKTYRKLDKDDDSDSDWKQYTNEKKKVLLHGTEWTHLRHQRFEGNESSASMKGRHGKFYHIAKCLTELVHVYSPRLMDAKPSINTFYHGINRKMNFVAMSDEIVQPLSTTTSFEVAVMFGGKIGMVLELNCGGWARYFHCAWISDFPNEKECLFINTVGWVKVVNIVDTLKAIDYDIYVKALSIIDAVVTGTPFQPDTKVIESIRKRQNMSDRLNLVLNGAEPIDPRLKMITLRLIKHELQRYQPQKYSKMKNIPPYIEGLLHCICLRTKGVTLNWQLMSVEMNERYNSGGYNGFLFLKSLFYSKHLEMFDFYFISLLFPNVTYITVTNCSSVKTTCWNFILNFLQTKQAEQLLGISIDCQFIDQDSKLYNDFKQIGWVLEVNFHQSYWWVFLTKKTNEKTGCKYTPNYHGYLNFMNKYNKD